MLPISGTPGRDRGLQLRSLAGDGDGHHSLAAALAAPSPLGGRDSHV
jgi:hypothetical protein